MESADLPSIDGIDDLVVVGRGGFATVYRGHQEAFQRDVAVKVLQRSGLDSDNRARFERECKAMGSLSNHPGIVTLYEAGFTTDGRPYLVMSFVADGSLDDGIRRNGPMTWEDVSDLGVRLAGALETAHRAGVVHRDVKPANVLRSPYGSQLSDFGIARLQGGHETVSGVITASVSHAAPEILDGEPPGVGGDVYSLASTMYAALAGRAAFARRTDEALVSQVMRVITEPTPDLRLRGVPGPLAEVIETAMAKDPSERFASAGIFGQQLRSVQTRLGRRETDLVVVGVPVDHRTRLDTASGLLVLPPTVPDGAPFVPSMSPPPPGPQDSTPAGDARLPATAPLVRADPDVVVQPAQSAPEPASRRKPIVAITAGAVVAATLLAFTLWPRSDDPVAEPDNAVTTAAVSSLSTSPSTSTATSTSSPSAGPIVTGVELAPGVELISTIDISNDTTIAGQALTGIDGVGYDSLRRQLLVARESAPTDVRTAFPSLSEPAVFFVPADLGSGDLSNAIDPQLASVVVPRRVTGEPYGLDLDVEGLAALTDGTFFVISEGNVDVAGTGIPFAHRLDAGGGFVSAAQLPPWLVPDDAGTKGFTPGRTLHGVDERPGRPTDVVVAIESPLIQDHDASVVTGEKVARLISFDIETGAPTAEWGYPLEMITPEAAAVTPTAASVIVDIARLPDDSLAVLESTYTDAGRTFQLHRVQLGNGSAPAPELPAQLEKSVIAAPPGTDNPLNVYRSIAAGPILDDGRQSLVLVSDNGFGEEATTVGLIALES